MSSPPDATDSPRAPGRRRSRARLALTVLALVLAVGLALFAVWGRREELLTAVRRMDAPSLGGSLAAGLAAGVSTFLGWRVMLADLGARVAVGPAARIYFLGQLGKYIPGSVWPVVTQMELGRIYGVPRAASAAAATWTLVIAAITGVLTAVVVLPLTAGSLLADYAWVAFAAVPLLLLLVPAVGQRLLALAARILRRRVEVPRTSLAGTAATAGLLVLSWVLFGLHLHLLVAATCACSPSLGLDVGLFALAWVSGFLVVFAPAGAGAREGVLVLGLAGVLSPASALAVALVSRVVLTLADLLVAGAAALAARGRSPAAR